MRRFVPYLLAGGTAALLGLSMVLFGVSGFHAVRPMRSDQPRQALSQGSVAQVVRRGLPAMVRVTVLRPTGLRTSRGRPLSVKVTGSGFVVDARGGVLTSAGLVAGAQRTEVRCRRCGSSLPVTRVTLDGLRDVAYLRVHPPRRLAALRLGPAEGPAAGSYVVALGGESAQFGVVSAEARVFAQTDGTTRRLLQTDASIHAGNAGGPLLDLEGRVVGMSTYSVSAGKGIGFAVPARDLRLAIGRSGA